MAQVVKHLPSKHEFLISFPIPQKKIKDILTNLMRTLTYLWEYELKENSKTLKEHHKSELEKLKSEVIRE
jgi:hypothetical protein